MKFKDVDSYIAKAPLATRAKLSQLRSTIKTSAPDAEEVISYNMPYYKYHGLLVGFALFKNHIGLFGALSPKEKDLFKDYETTKGSIHLPLDKPLPVARIKKLVKMRIAVNEDRHSRRA